MFENDFCHFYLLYTQASTSYTTDNLISTGNLSVYSSIIQKPKYKLAKLITKLESEFQNKNFTYQILIDYDVLTDAIKQAITSRKIDLIVMGTNGVTGTKEVLFGSHTINVIRKVNCPTLIIPEGFNYRKPKDILLPLDAFDSISGSPFIDIIKFTKQYSKKLHLLRIKPNNEDSKKQQMDKKHIDYFLKETNHFYHCIENIPIHYAVDFYTQTNHIDLITLLVQKESFFERFFIGSPTTKISHQIRVPLLIFHSH